MTRVFWFRRDLRLQDNLALNAAISGSIVDGDSRVVPLYLLDEKKFLQLSPVRQHSLVASLDALGSSLSRKLTIRHGQDLQAIAKQAVLVAQSAKAKVVHATRAFDPAGIAEQNAIGLALADVEICLQLDDSNYAIAPGQISKPDGSPYRVYTPFHKAWLQRGWQAPQKLIAGASWFEAIECMGLPQPSAAAPFPIRAGEEFAIETLNKFRSRALSKYHQQRDRADLSGTSHLSHALAHGEIHPRTILAAIGFGEGPEVFRKEICWREFYADVLFHNPNSLTDYYDPKYKKMRYDIGAEALRKLAAWKSGTTGYPMVDAGMRQLRETGWMHNRVRMIVASFLVKDLHLEWQAGAQHFEELLTDFDPASNSHGWQWTAGSGTDASPYYRVFNPVTQGLKFDPNGDYVRRYIPELRHISGADAHEPWNLLHGYLHGYPERIVDHAREREEALARLADLKNQR